MAQENRFEVSNLESRLGRIDLGFCTILDIARENRLEVSNSASQLKRIDLGFRTIFDITWENQPNVSFPRYYKGESTWGIIFYVTT